MSHRLWEINERRLFDRPIESLASFNQRQMGFVFRRVSSSRSDHLAVRWFAHQLLFANVEVGGNLAGCCLTTVTFSAIIHASFSHQPPQRIRNPMQAPRFRPESGKGPNFVTSNHTQMAQTRTRLVPDFRNHFRIRTYKKTGGGWGVSPTSNFSFHRPGFSTTRKIAEKRPPKRS
jgi:hypothetical protein